MNDELRVYARDLLGGEWQSITPAEWVGTVYAEMVADSLAAHRETVGGTLHLTGTPERGRVQVLDAAGQRFLDCDWQTMSSEEIAAAAMRRV